MPVYTCTTVFPYIYDIKCNMTLAWKGNDVDDDVDDDDDGDDDGDLHDHILWLGRFHECS